MARKRMAEGLLAGLTEAVAHSKSNIDLKHPKYAINIKWSKVDKCFVATVPKLKSCTTDGKTIIEAARNIQKALKLQLQSITDKGLLK